MSSDARRGHSGRFILKAVNVGQTLHLAKRQFAPPIRFSTNITHYERKCECIERSSPAGVPVVGVKCGSLAERPAVRTNVSNVSSGQRSAERARRIHIE